MKPWLVKKGAQANLKALGAEIIREFENDESAFGPVFYNDLVAKMILFRMADAAVQKADWYMEERGLKAEIVTYSIALLRHALLQRNKELNLSSIYRNQAASETLLATIVSLAKSIRERITDLEFTGGITNPSEFCKSEKGWKRIQGIDVDFSFLQRGDVLSAAEAAEAKQERRDVNKASRSISGLEYVMSVAAEEWDLLADYHGRTYPPSHKNVGIPRKCAELHRYGKMLSDKQLDTAKDIREAAYNSGFDFVR